MKRASLVKMKVKETGTIVEIEGGSMFEKRLASMGINVGKHVTKLSSFVMRGPVAIKVGRTVVALGYGMASKVWVNSNKK
ncbi:MAG: ferrous iron transport protein A [Candidatus Omnitrophica bacterium]|nr:ferrous iron transport protein A [Candidatus Omnitrophota bacterium]